MRRGEASFCFFVHFHFSRVLRQPRRSAAQRESVSSQVQGTRSQVVQSDELHSEEDLHEHSFAEEQLSDDAELVQPTENSEQNNTEIELGEALPEATDTDGGVNPVQVGAGENSDGETLRDSCQNVTLPGYWNSVLGLTEIDCHGDDCSRLFVKSKFATCQNGAFVFPPSQKNSTPENIFLRENGDSCVDSTHVWEASSFTAYPNAGGLNNLRVCPEGTSCQNGACVGEAVSCRELLAGHNDATQRRMNLIFVGSDYQLIDPRNIQEGTDAFLWDIDAILGENSQSGLFDLAPFQDLKDKFNIWYVDHFAEMEPVVEPYDFTAHQRRNVRGRENAAMLMNECIREQDLNDAYTYLVHLVPNKGTLDSAITLSTFRTVQLFEPAAYQSCQAAVENAIELMPDQDRDGCLTDADFPAWQLVNYQPLSTYAYNRALDYNHDGRANTSADTLLFSQLVKVAASKDLCSDEPDFQNLVENICASGIDNLGRSLFHGATLAHELGHTLGMFDVSSQRPAATQDPDLDQLTIANCFIADSEQACREHAPWKNLIGNGCGAPGVEDCHSSDLYYETEITCAEGCLPGVKSYRSTRGGTYVYGTALTGTGVNYHAYDQPFGEWDAWYLQQLIESTF